MRLHKIPDSAVSGALTGGVLNAWKRTLRSLSVWHTITEFASGGPAGVAPGATTASLICILLQVAYNELGIWRIKYVSRKLEENYPLVGSNPSADQHASIFTTPHIQPEERKPFFERFFELLGMPKISDEEYVQKLKAKREVYLRRIAELEAEKDRLQRANQDARSGRS